MFRLRGQYTLDFLHCSKIKFTKSVALSNLIKLATLQVTCLISKNTKRLDIPMATRQGRLDIRFTSLLAHTSDHHKHLRASRQSLRVCKLSIYRLLYLENEFSYRRWQHSQAFTTNTRPDASSGGSPSEYYTKEELLKLVDHYHIVSTPDRYSNLDRGALSRPSKDTHNWPEESEDDFHQILPTNQETVDKIQKLQLALEAEPKNLDYIFDLYRALPDKRVGYLNPQMRHKLLHVLSVMEFKDEHSMLRYLSVVEDTKASGLRLTICEWNSAICFVARYVRITTTSEVEAALRMWREMENSAGIRGDNVTFHILFDVACRAGRFTLAEMIFKEMGSRGLEYTRYHHVTKIMFHGLRQDGDGVRTTYRELIQAGEIVDTVVLNAMISALIKAGEPTSAENLYQRMKMAHLARTDATLPPKDFASRRLVNQALMHATRLTKQDKKKREELQNKSIIAPDSITYLILIEYFSVQAGNLGKTIVFLEEMKWFALPVRGVIFVKLFKSFYIHGGIRYTSWTAGRLELVYTSFLNLLQSNEKEIFLSWWIVLWMLKAFVKCTDASRALAVWEESTAKWKPEHSDMEHLASVVDYIKTRSFAQRKDSYFNDLNSSI